MNNSDLVIKDVSNMNKILVGSRAFFTGIEGFTPHDYDYVDFCKPTWEFKNVRQLKFPDKCMFTFVRKSNDELIDFALNNEPAMQVGKFLVPEVVNYLGMSFDDIKRLAPVFDKLDDKHKYEKIIFDAYLENGKMELTDEQRLKAFECYKKARENE